MAARVSFMSIAAGVLFVLVWFVQQQTAPKYVLLDPRQGSPAPPPTQVVEVIVQYPTEPPGTPTKSPTPKEPTSTPRATWGVDTTATPGRIYRVPAWTPTPKDPNLEPTLVYCPEVTPDQYSSTDCRGIE